MAKVFIIEDNIQTLKIYTEALMKAGFEVIQEKSAEFPFGNLADMQPDLIILDIMLPGKKNGFDLLEELARDEVLKKIPVLVLTNLDTEEKVAKEIGAKEYFVKSQVSIDEVIKKAKSLTNQD
jgi:DNA-binding response OmpR family regulator